MKRRRKAILMAWAVALALIAGVIGPAAAQEKGRMPKETR